MFELWMHCDKSPDLGKSKYGISYGHVWPKTRRSTIHNNLRVSRYPQQLEVLSIVHDIPRARA